MVTRAYNTPVAPSTTFAAPVQTGHDVRPLSWNPTLSNRKDALEAHTDPVFNPPFLIRLQQLPKVNHSVRPTGSDVCTSYHTTPAYQPAPAIFKAVSNESNVDQTFCPFSSAPLGIYPRHCSRALH